MNPHERAKNLLALATNPTTPIEEARASAHAAARLIVEHKMLGDMKGFTGLGSFKDLLSMLPMEKIAQNAMSVVTSATAIEIAQLRYRVAELERKNERLRDKLRRRRFR